MSPRIGALPPSFFFQVFGTTDLFYSRTTDCLFVFYCLERAVNFPFFRFNALCSEMHPFCSDLLTMAFESGTGLLARLFFRISQRKWAPSFFFLGMGLVVQWVRSGFFLVGEVVGGGGGGRGFFGGGSVCV